MRTLLDEAQVGIAGDETAIGDALGMAVKRLRDRPASETASSSCCSPTALQATPARSTRAGGPPAAEEGIRVYTIGVGADAVVRCRRCSDQRVVDLSGRSRREHAAGDRRHDGRRHFRAKNVGASPTSTRRIDALEPASGEPPASAEWLFPWPLPGVALALTLGLGGALTVPSLAPSAAASSIPTTGVNS